MAPSEKGRPPVPSPGSRVRRRPDGRATCSSRKHGNANDVGAWHGLGVVVLLVGVGVAATVVADDSPSRRPRLLPPRLATPTLSDPGRSAHLRLGRPRLRAPARWPSDRPERSPWPDAIRHRGSRPSARWPVPVVAGDGKEGSPATAVPPPRPSSRSVSDMAFAPNGDLYLADGSRVRAVNRGGDHSNDRRRRSLLARRSIATAHRRLSAPLGPVASIGIQSQGELTSLLRTM